MSSPLEVERRIMRRLLRGALAACVDCRRALEPGEPRVTVPTEPPSQVTLLRCTDCEYRSLYG